MTSLESLEDFFGCSSPQLGPAEDSRFPNRKLRYKVWDSDDCMWAEQIVRHYDACRQQLTTTTPQRPSSKHDIPKIFHFIWIGPSPIPQIHNTTAVRSFKEQHPDWTFRIWNERDILALPLFRNRDAFRAAAGNYGRQSDIARYEILYNYGGVYVDMDYRCIDALDDFNRRCEFYCGASNAGTVELNNGLIGCVKGHWLMLELITRIKEWHSRRSKLLLSKNSLSKYLDDNSNHTIESMSQVRDVMDTIEFTGPGVFTRVICQNLFEGQMAARDDVMILPARVFHPFPNHLRHFAADEDVVDRFIMVGETKAVHLWACSWH